MEDTQKPPPVGMSSIVVWPFNMFCPTGSWKPRSELTLFRSRVAEEFPEVSLDLKWEAVGKASFGARSRRLNII